MSFFRYPGGKSKIKNDIIQFIIDKSGDMDLEYREPFFGGGSIGTNIINKRPFRKIWINDVDIGISCLWSSVMNTPEALKELVKSFQPSIDEFERIKKILTSPIDPISLSAISEIGFLKLAIHQISYSGLGVMSGGPLGGREQKSAYKIGCRWSPSYICKKIDKINNIFKNHLVRHSGCTSFDFSKVIEDDQFPAILYLDPPYYEKGNDLYQFGFSEDDHIRLRDTLAKTKNKWILSYDDCPQIRKLYDGVACIKEISDVKYSITAAIDKESGKKISRKKNELLIFSKE